MSANVALIDTSVLCEILAVPGKCSDAEHFREELASMVESHDYTLLLPMTSILETGNHIGQCSTDGGRRRKAAQDFVHLVGQALKGELPFHPTPFFDVEKIAAWIVHFPDWTMRSDAKGKGSGLGDLTIQKEWERQCELNSGRRVYIWSLDQQLQRYDTRPKL